jgi:hypothetical protein
MYSQKSARRAAATIESAQLLHTRALACFCDTRGIRRHCDDGSALYDGGGGDDGVLLLPPPPQQRKSPPPARPSAPPPTPPSSSTTTGAGTWSTGTTHRGSERLPRPRRCRRECRRGCRRGGAPAARQRVLRAVPPPGSAGTLQFTTAICRGPCNQSDAREGVTTLGINSN